MCRLFVEAGIRTIESKSDWIWNRLKWLKEKIKLKDGQLYWYYKKYNGYLNKDKIKQEYPCTPEEAFLNSGNCVFDSEVLMQRKTELEELYKTRPYKQGFFEFKWNNEETKDFIIDSSIKFIENPIGMIKMYEQPKSGGFYVLGGDTAGDGSDYNTGTCLNNTTGKRVATIRTQINSDIYTYQMYCLGKFYNNAMIAIEVNFNTFPVIELKRLRYPHQYKREEYDSISKKLQEKFGWRTDRNTRPLMISEEQAMIRDHIELFVDIIMILECLSFVYDEDMRPDAMEGKHDDLLFSDMIAQATRWQQQVEKVQPKKLEGFFTDTELEDLGYKNINIKVKLNNSIRARRR